MLDPYTGAPLDNTPDMTPAVVPKAVGLQLHGAAFCWASMT